MFGTSSHRNRSGNCSRGPQNAEKIDKSSVVRILKIFLGHSSFAANGKLPHTISTFIQCAENQGDAWFEDAEDGVGESVLPLQ